MTIIRQIRLKVKAKYLVKRILYNKLPEEHIKDNKYKSTFIFLFLNIK